MSLLEPVLHHLCYSWYQFCIPFVTPSTSSTSPLSLLAPVLHSLFHSWHKFYIIFVTPDTSSIAPSSLLVPVLHHLRHSWYHLHSLFHSWNQFYIIFVTPGTSFTAPLSLLASFLHPLYQSRHITLLPPTSLLGSAPMGFSVLSVSQLRNYHCGIWSEKTHHCPDTAGLDFYILLLGDNTVDIYNKKQQQF